MKKLAVLAVLFLSMGMILAACGNGGDEDDNGSGTCSDLQGTYAVTKNITSVDYQGTPINNPGFTPLTSSLEINQALCALVAVEDSAVTYIGQADGDDFDLYVENPQNLTITLTLDLQVIGSTTCDFNGSIDWNGTRKSGGDLIGEVVYSLTQHPNEPQKAECPDWITAYTDFDGIKN